MIPYSKLGINKEDLDLLQNRLYPGVNEVFLQRLAEERKIDYKKLPELDYEEHPLYKRDRMIAIREQKRQYLKGKDTSKFDVKFKTIEEAQELDPVGKHVLLEENKIPLEELEARFPKLTTKTALDELSSDSEEDEKKA